MLERITDEIGHSWFAPAVTLAAALENERRSPALERVRERERFAANGNDLRERKSTSRERERERERFMVSIEQR
jgi:hypothetical protein